MRILYIGILEIACCIYKSKLKTELFVSKGITSRKMYRLVSISLEIFLRLLDIQGFLNAFPEFSDIFCKVLFRCFKVLLEFPWLIYPLVGLFFFLHFRSVFSKILDDLNISQAPWRALSSVVSIQLEEDIHTSLMYQTSPFRNLMIYSIWVSSILHFTHFPAGEFQLHELSSLLLGLCCKQRHGTMYFITQWNSRWDSLVCLIASTRATEVSKSKITVHWVTIANQVDLELSPSKTKQMIQRCTPIKPLACLPLLFRKKR